MKSAITTMPSVNERGTMSAMHTTAACGTTTASNGRRSSHQTIVVHGSVASVNPMTAAQKA